MMCVHYYIDIITAADDSITYKRKFKINRHVMYVNYSLPIKLHKRRQYLYVKTKTEYRRNAL